MNGLHDFVGNSVSAYIRAGHRENQILGFVKKISRLLALFRV